MEEVVDRVIVNENHLNQEIRKFSPLVETYIQNLKQDKALGFTPAGDKYFGPRGFCEGREPGFLDGRGYQRQKDFFRDRKFLFVRDAVSARRLLADDFHRHERLRQAAL
jgi:hypothetical protein